MSDKQIIETKTINFIYIVDYQVLDQDPTDQNQIKSQISKSSFVFDNITLIKDCPPVFSLIKSYLTGSAFLR